MQDITLVCLLGLIGCLCGTARRGIGLLGIFDDDDDEHWPEGRGEKDNLLLFRCCLMDEQNGVGANGDGVHTSAGKKG